MNKLIRRWIEKLRVAFWLHPEVDIARRATIFGAVALVAATAIAHVPMKKVLVEVAPADQQQELVAVTRWAFVPRLFVQAYYASPTLSYLLAG
jgi:hypothetical protein